MMHRKYLKHAFTLAEVLITLSIIGVVASLVLVPLSNNFQKTKMASYDKKAKSVIQNAFAKAAADNGGSLDGFNLGTNLGEYIKLKENCNVTRSYNCWHGSTPGQILQSDGSYKNFVTKTNYGVIALDGLMLSLNSGNINCDIASYDSSNGCYHYDFNQGYCGTIYMDINGAQPPNIWGQDIREVYYFKNGRVRFQGQSVTRYTSTRLLDSAQYSSTNENASCYNPNVYTTTNYD